MDRSDEIPKDCLSYHPLSELKNRDGYYPNISKSQMEAYHQVMKKLREKNLILHEDGEHEFLKVLRFLRARKFDVSKTFAMLEADIKWRNDNERFKLATVPIDDYLGCDFEKLYPFIPNFEQGYDKEGRPLVYIQVGKWNLTAASKIIPINQIVKYDTWHGFRLGALVQVASKKINYNIETCGCVFDMEGLGMNMLTTDFFTYARALSSNDSDHNPERAGWVMIINAHWVFRTAWNVIQVFVDEVTKKKIMILGDRDEWMDILKNLVDEDQLPVAYGGTLPDLTVEEIVAEARHIPIDETFVTGLKPFIPDDSQAVSNKEPIDIENLVVQVSQRRLSVEKAEDSFVTEAERENMTHVIEEAVKDGQLLSAGDVLDRTPV